MATMWLTCDGPGCDQAVEVWAKIDEALVENVLVNRRSGSAPSLVGWCSRGVDDSAEAMRLLSDGPISTKGKHFCPKHAGR